MSRWQEIVTRELRRAGPTRADKKEAFREAKRLYHGGAEHRMNPSLGGSNLVKYGLIAGLAYGGYKLYEAHQAAKQKPNPYALPLYPTGATPSNAPT